MRPYRRIKQVVVDEDGYVQTDKMLKPIDIKLVYGWLCLWWYARKSNNSKRKCRKHKRNSIRYQ